MVPFDPSLRPLRFAPHILAVAGLAILSVLLWRVLQPLPQRDFEPSPEQLIRMDLLARAAASERPGLGRMDAIDVKVAPGDTLESAITHAGVSAEQAKQAVAALKSGFDVVHIRAGLPIEAAIAVPLAGGPAQLLGLTFRTGPATQATLNADQTGAFKLRMLEEKVTDERTVAVGQIEGSLFQSATALGASAAITSQVAKLFSHKLDFQRDIHAGDGFKLIFDRKVTESGRTVQTGALIFAELQAKGSTTRFYRFKPKGDSEAQYFDDSGKNIKGLLLRTPVDGARVTSGFGMRFHPVLGYEKQHQGIDFAAGTGTPVLASGDGVVVEAKWWGGYGRWMRVRHSKDWETGYAHLSRWVATPGQKVHQGQVIAYSGATGRVTGPHVHYEVWYKGQRINPTGAKVPQGTILAGADLVAFKAEKSEIDRLILAKIRGVDPGPSAALPPATNDAPTADTASEIPPASGKTSGRGHGKPRARKHHHR